VRWLSESCARRWLRLLALAKAQAVAGVGVGVGVRESALAYGPVKVGGDCRGGSLARGLGESDVDFVGRGDAARSCRDPGLGGADEDDRLLSTPESGRWRLPPAPRPRLRFLQFIIARIDSFLRL
jgi:hypothetical protein